MPASDLGFDTASWGRRFLALMVDWVACTLVVVVIVGLEEYGEIGGAASLLVTGVFVVESAVFTATMGGSFGQIATRLRVVRADGAPGPVPPLKVIARQVLIALVIPPLVFRPDGRGLHDLAAGSATVTLDTWRDRVATT